MTAFCLYLRGPSTLGTFVAVYALFGPTFPGIYDKERGVYCLFYPVRHMLILFFQKLAQCFYHFLTVAGAILRVSDS